MPNPALTFAERLSEAFDHATGMEQAIFRALDDAALNAADQAEPRECLIVAMGKLAQARRLLTDAKIAYTAMLPTVPALTATALTPPAVEPATTALPSRSSLGKQRRVVPDPDFVADSELAIVANPMRVVAKAQGSDPDNARTRDDDF